MSFLDMRTVLFTNMLTSVVAMLVILLLWGQARDRFAGTGFWVLDFASQTTATFLIVLRGNIPDWASIVLANTLVLAGALLGYMGLGRFTGKKLFQAHNYVLLAAFFCIHAYFAFVQPDLTARNINSSIALLILFFQCAWLLLFGVEPAMRRLTRKVGMVFGAYCLVNILRIAWLLGTPHTESDFLKSGPFDNMVLLSYQTLYILLTYFLVLMFNDRLLGEVRTQEEKFAKAFQSSPYAISLTRLSDGKIFEVNKGFVTLSGYGYDEVIGKTTPDLRLWVREEDRKAAVDRLMKRGKIKESEFQFRKKSGESLIGLFSADIIAIHDEKYVLSSISDITERRLAEDLIHVRVGLFEFAASHSLEELLQKTLDEVGVLTRSPIGFYHFMESDQKTLTLQAWSTATVKEFCNAEGKGLHYRVDEAGVWVDAVHQRRPVIHNDYASLPHRKGLPPGHPMVVRELVVPILRAGRIVALLGVGNKPIDYTERDVEIVSFLADVAWTIAEGKRAEEERAKLVSELQENLARVKLLSGLLPICSSCKKIRDDKGYWTQIESYVRSHSEADFSHSICPDCARKLYPDVNPYDAD